MDTVTADTIFHVLLSVLTLGFFALVFAARFLQSVRATRVLAFVASAFAFALAAVSPSSTIGRGQGLTVPLLGMGAIMAAAGWYCGRRLRAAQVPLPDRLAAERARLTPHEVAAPLGGWTGAGTCLHCGRRPAPLRPIRFVHSVVGGPVAASESLDIAIPLCEEHPPDVNEGWGSLGAVAVLLGFLVFAAGFVAALAARIPQWTRGPVLLGAIVLGIGSGRALARWGRSKQTFRLVRVNPLTGIVIIALNDARRAAQARAEAVKLWDAIVTGS